MLEAKLKKLYFDFKILRLYSAILYFNAFCRSYFEIEQLFLKSVLQ
jgi:hypothetical protein